MRAGGELAVRGTTVRRAHEVCLLVGLAKHTSTIASSRAITLTIASVITEATSLTGPVLRVLSVDPRLRTAQRGLGVPGSKGSKPQATAAESDNGAMPFTRVQQRYEQYSKYATRCQAGIDAFAAVEGQIKAGDWAKVDATSPAFALRTLGLLANGLMASENTSPANVVFLTRWYVNEVYLDLGDVAKAKDKKDALASWARGKGALNSALIILNKEISPKVGAQFATL